MEYIDLNLQNKELMEGELKLGFSQVHFAKINHLRSGKDFNAVNSKELLCIESADIDLLKNCIKQKKPILCNPLFARDFYKDEGLIREAAERETAFEIPISEFLKLNFISRAKLINQTRNFLKKCLKLDAKFVFTSRATSAYELKTPNEMIAIITTVFGLSRNQAQYAISTRAAKVLELQG